MTAPQAVHDAGGREHRAAKTVADVVSAFIEGALGCDRLYTVPGEAFLPLLAAADRTGLQIVTARHEAGAGFAALADAMLGGSPAVVAVNRSPGATNVSIALDAARADQCPLLCVAGGARRGTDPRTGFQAVDLAPFLGALVPTVVLETADALPEALAQAESILTGPRPGPLALIVPEDVWVDPTGGAAGPFVTAVPATAHQAGPTTADRRAAESVARALGRAARPVLVAGRLLRRAARPGRDPAALLAALAERAGVPVLASNKQQDLLDNGHPCYAGHLHVGTPRQTRQRLANADAVVVLGDLADDVHLAGWHQAQSLFVVHPEPAGPGEHLCADAPAVLELLAARAWPAVSQARAAWLGGWQRLEDELSRAVPRARHDGVDFTAVAAALDHHLPGDAVVTLDAGNFSSHVHRYLRLRGRQRLLALAAGAMGFGVPAAVGVVLRQPDRTVVAVAGDGGLLMTGNELATALATGRAPVVVVADNASYGTIRAHQAREFPGVDCGTGLHNPDLVAWAASFGLRGELVERPEDCGPALEHALGSREGYLLQVRTSLEAVHANQDLPAEPERLP